LGLALLTIRLTVAKQMSENELFCAKLLRLISWWQYAFEKETESDLEVVG